MNLELFDTQTDRLTIHHKGVTFTLNQRLIKEQDLSASQINDIINLHKSRIDIEIAVKLTPHLAKEYFQQWTDIQNGLQLAWGFPVDENYLRFWDFPLCECPKLDNLERLGTAYKIYNETCPIHGWKD
jgi:hypothetical protein